MVPSASGPKKIAMRLHVNRGHAAARQVIRLLVVFEGGARRFLRRVGRLLSQREARRAFDKTPHAPVARTSTVALSTEKLPVHLLFPEDIITAHVMDVLSK